MKKKTFWIKTSALLTALTLAFEPGMLQASSPSSAPSAPGIRIPQEWGEEEISLPGSSGKTIYFIQDAHDSLEAQKNIASIIVHLTEKEKIKTVFEEGYEGPVPTERYFGFVKDPGERLKVSSFLLDRLRIGGAEFAHINRKTEFKLIGADNLETYRKNIEAFREASRIQKDIDQDLQKVLTELRSLAAQKFPKPLRDWLEARTRYGNHQLDLLSFLQRSWKMLGAQPEADQNRFPSLSVLLGTSGKPPSSLDPKAVFRKIYVLDKTISELSLKEETDLRLFRYLEAFSLLERLNRMEISPEEYEAAREILSGMNTREVADFAAREGNKSLVLSKAWEDGLKHAVSFYERAEERDQAVERTLRNFMDQPSEASAVLVFGGFHKEALLSIMRRLGFSVRLINPLISGPDPLHESYYHQLMSAGYHEYERALLPSPAGAAQATRPPSAFVEPFGEEAVRQIYAAAKASPQTPPELLERLLKRSELRVNSSGDDPDLLRRHPQLAQIAAAWNDYLESSEAARVKFNNAYEGGVFERSPFQWMDFAAKNYGLTAQSRVLDVGSGNGLAALAFHILSGAEVTSIEIDPMRWTALQGFLRYLKDEKGLEFPKVRFEQADFLEYPLEGFDLIYFYFTHPVKYKTFHGNFIAERLSENLPEGSVFFSPGFYLDQEYKGMLIRQIDRPRYFAERGLRFESVRIPDGNLLQHTNTAAVLSRAQTRDSDVRSELRSISSYDLRNTFGDLFSDQALGGGRNEAFLYENGKKAAVIMPWSKFIYRALDENGNEIPTRIFKITHAMSDNSVLFEEAKRLFQLQAEPAVAGVPKIRRIGIMKNGAMWMELEGIAGARSLEREIFGRVPRLFSVLIRSAEILEAVHERGIFHSDIKPDNFLINTAQELELIDFGASYTRGFAALDENKKPITENLGKDSDAYSFIMMSALLIEHQIQSQPPPVAEALKKIRDRYLGLILEKWTFTSVDDLFMVGPWTDKLTPRPRKDWPKDMETVARILRDDLQRLLLQFPDLAKPAVPQEKRIIHASVHSSQNRSAGEALQKLLGALSGSGALHAMRIGVTDLRRGAVAPAFEEQLESFSAQSEIRILLEGAYLDDCCRQATYTMLNYARRSPSKSFVFHFPVDLIAYPHDYLAESDAEEKIASLRFQLESDAEGLPYEIFIDGAAQTLPPEDKLGENEKPRIQLYLWSDSSRMAAFVSEQSRSELRTLDEIKPALENTRRISLAEGGKILISGFDRSTQVLAEIRSVERTAGREIAGRMKSPRSEAELRISAPPEIVILRDSEWLEFLEEYENRPGDVASFGHWNWPALSSLRDKLMARTFSRRFMSLQTWLPEGGKLHLFGLTSQNHIELEVTSLNLQEKTVTLSVHAGSRRSADALKVEPLNPFAGAKPEPARSELRSDAAAELQGFGRSAPLWDFLTAFGIDPVQAKIEPMENPWGRVPAAQHAVFGVEAGNALREAVLESAYAVFDSREIRERLKEQTIPEEKALDFLYLLTFEKKPAALVWAIPGEPFQPLFYYPLAGPGFESLWKESGSEAKTLESSPPLPQDLERFIRSHHKKEFGRNPLLQGGLPLSMQRYGLPGGTLREFEEGVAFPTVFSLNHPTSRGLVENADRLIAAGLVSVEGETVSEVGTGAGWIAAQMALRGAFEVHAYDLNLLKAANASQTAQRYGAAGRFHAYRSRSAQILPPSRLYLWNIPDFADSASGVLDQKILDQSASIAVNNRIPAESVREVFQELSVKARPDSLFLVRIHPWDEPVFFEVLRNSGWEMHPASEKEIQNPGRGGSFFLLRPELKGEAALKRAREDALTQNFKGPSETLAALRSVAEELQPDRHGFPILLIEGLPGSGKSSRAEALKAVLESQGRKAVVIHSEHYLLQGRYNKPLRAFLGLLARWIARQPNERLFNYAAHAFVDTARVERWIREISNLRAEGGLFTVDPDHKVQEDLTPGTVLIIEGTLSSHLFGKLPGAKKLFLDVPPQTIRRQFVKRTLIEAAGGVVYGSFKARLMAPGIAAGFFRRHSARFDFILKTHSSGAVSLIRPRISGTGLRPAEAFEKAPRSELRATHPLDLSGEEKRLILDSTKTAYQRQGAGDGTRPLWLFGETDVMDPFTETFLGKPSPASIDPKLFREKKVLVIPGYGNLPFLLRALGAREVVAADIDPVTIAWQKLKWKSGLEDLNHWLFVSESSRVMIQSAVRQQWLRALNSPVNPKDTFDRMSFQTADILQPLPVTGEKYDLIVVPYLFGFVHGLVDESAWDKALSNMDQALASGGRIVLTPGDIDLSRLTDSREKDETRDYLRWVRDLQQRDWNVSFSGRYPFLNILGHEPVQAAFAVLSRRSELRSETPEDKDPFARSEKQYEELLGKAAALSPSSPRLAEALAFAEALENEPAAENIHLKEAVRIYKEVVEEHNSGAYRTQNPIRLYLDDKRGWYDLLNNVMSPVSMTLALAAAFPGGEGLEEASSILVKNVRIMRVLGFFKKQAETGARAEEIGKLFEASFAASSSADPLDRIAETSYGPYTLRRIVQQLEVKQGIWMFGPFLFEDLSAEDQTEVEAALSPETRRRLGLFRFIDRAWAQYEPSAAQDAGVEKLILRKNSASLAALLSEIFSFGTKYDAYGVSNGFQDYLQILFEGKVRSRFRGSLTDHVQFHSDTAGSHGPFYILFKNPVLDPDERSNHQAYLVPEASDKEAVSILADKAAEEGLITAADAQDIKGKLITYQAFVDRQRSELRADESPAVSPDEAAAFFEKIRTVFRGLPPDFRHDFSITYQFKTPEEIAAHFGTTDDTVVQAVLDLYRRRGFMMGEESVIPRADAKPLYSRTLWINPANPDFRFGAVLELLKRGTEAVEDVYDQRDTEAAVTLMEKTLTGKTPPAPQPTLGLAGLSAWRDLLDKTIALDQRLSQRSEEPKKAAPGKLPPKPVDELRVMRASLRHYLRRQVEDRTIDPKQYEFVSDILPYRILAAKDARGKILGFAFGKKGNRHMHAIVTEKDHEPDGFLYEKDDHGIRIITYVTEGGKNYKEDVFVLGRFGDVYRLKIEESGGSPSQQSVEYHNWMPSYMLTRAQEVEALSRVLGPQLYEGVQRFIPENTRLVLAPGMEPEARMTYWPSVQGSVRSREEVFGGLDHEGFDIAHIRRQDGAQEQLAEGTAIRSLVNEPGRVQWTFEDNVQSTAVVLSGITLPVGSKRMYVPRNPDDMGRITIGAGGVIQFPEGVEYDVIDTPGEKYRVAFVYTHLALADWVKPGAEISAGDQRTIGTIEKHRRYPYSPVVPHLHFAVMLFKESEIEKYPQLNYEILNRKLGPDKTVLYVNPLSLLSPDQRGLLFVEGPEAAAGFESAAIQALSRDALKSVRARVSHTLLGIPVWTAVSPGELSKSMADSDLVIRQSEAGWLVNLNSRLKTAVPDESEAALPDEDSLIRYLQRLDYKLRVSRNQDANRSELRIHDPETLKAELKKSTSLMHWHHALSAYRPEKENDRVEVTVQIARGIRIHLAAARFLFSDPEFGDAVHRYLAAWIYNLSVVYGTSFAAAGSENDPSLVDPEKIQKLLTQGDLASIRESLSKGAENPLGIANYANAGRPVRIKRLTELTDEEKEIQPVALQVKLQTQVPGTYLGIDIGGGSAKWAVLQDGKLLDLPKELKSSTTHLMDSGSNAVYESPEDYVARLTKRARDILDYLRKTYGIESIDGVGIDIPGAADFSSNTMVTLGQIPVKKEWNQDQVTWTGREIPRRMAEALGLDSVRVKIRNDMDGVLPGVASVLPAAKKDFWERTGGHFGFDWMGTGHGNQYAVAGVPMNAPTESGHMTFEFGRPGQPLFDTEAYTSIPSMLNYARQLAQESGKEWPEISGDQLKPLADQAFYEGGDEIQLQRKVIAMKVFDRFAEKYAANLTLRYVLAKNSGFGNASEILLGGGIARGRTGALLRDLTLQKLGTYGLDNKIRITVIQDDDIRQAGLDPDDVGPAGSAYFIQSLLAPPTEAAEDFELDTSAAPPSVPERTEEKLRALASKIEGRTLSWKDPSEKNPGTKPRKAVTTVSFKPYAQWKTGAGAVPLPADFHVSAGPDDEEIRDFPDLEKLRVNDPDLPNRKPVFGSVSGSFFTDENGRRVFVASIIQTGVRWKFLERSVKNRYDPIRGASLRPEGNLYSWYGSLIAALEEALRFESVDQIAVLSAEGIREIRSVSGVKIGDEIADKMYGKPGPGYAPARLKLRDESGAEHVLAVWTKELSRGPDSRSELRETAPAPASNKGTLLISAPALASLTPEGMDELFSRLYLNRADLRLIVFRDRFPDTSSRALKALLKLPNAFVTSETDYSAAVQKLGIPGAPAVLLLQAGESLRSGEKLVKGVLLKKQAGEIEFAKMLAFNGGTLPNIPEENGVYNPPAEFLSGLQERILSALVVAYSA